MWEIQIIPVARVISFAVCLKAVAQSCYPHKLKYTDNQPKNTQTAWASKKKNIVQLFVLVYSTVQRIALPTMQ